ncbi:MAG: MFS transporter [Lysobacterales bacterium]
MTARPRPASGSPAWPSAASPFSQKAGMGVAGFVVGILLTVFNYEAGAVQTPFTLTGIALMLSLISGVFHVIMGLLMFKYRITDSYYNDMKARGLIADEAPEYLTETPQL